LYGLPFHFRDAVPVAQEGRNYGRGEIGHRGCPGGIDAFPEGQGPAGGNHGQGEACRLRHFSCEVFSRNGDIFLLPAIEGVQGAGVEGGETATGEIILPLGADLVQGGQGVGRAIADRADRLSRRNRFLLPGGIGREVSEELIGLFLRDSRFAAAVDFCSQAIHDCLDNLPHGGIVSGVGRDDAVAVEARL